MGCSQSTTATDTPAPPPLHLRVPSRYSVEASNRSLLRIADHLDELEDAVPEAILDKWERLVERLMAQPSMGDHLPVEPQAMPAQQGTGPQSSPDDVDIVQATICTAPNEASVPVHTAADAEHLAASSPKDVVDAVAAAPTTEDIVDSVVQDVIHAALRDASDTTQGSSLQDAEAIVHDVNAAEIKYAVVESPEVPESPLSQRSNTMSFLKSLASNQSENAMAPSPTNDTLAQDSTDAAGKTVSPSNIAAPQDDPTTPPTSTQHLQGDTGSSSNVKTPLEGVTAEAEPVLSISTSSSWMGTGAAPTFEIRGTIVEGGVVKYLVYIPHKPKPVYRRFNDFKMLHAAVAPAMALQVDPHHRSDFPPVPRAGLLTRLYRQNQALVNERSLVFEAMLNAIANHPLASQSVEFQHFLA